MATRPVIEEGDCTVSGTDTAGSSWAVSFPAASPGDLLLANLAWDDNTTVTSVAAPNGPNGEIAHSIAGPVASASTEVRGQSWYYIAEGSWSSGTQTFTPSATESWSATVIKVPAGEFDPNTPIGASETAASTSTSSTSVASPAFMAGSTDSDGCVVWFAIVDSDPLVTLGSGWTSRQTQDLGAVAHGIATRDAAVTNSESIAAGSWSISSDSWASIAYVVRAPSRTYHVVYPSAESAPSAAQIKAGQRSSGSAATASGNEASRSTTGEEVFASAASGLTGGTSYKVSLVVNGSGGDGSVVTSAAWETTAVAAALAGGATGGAASTGALGTGIPIAGAAAGAATAAGGLTTGIPLAGAAAGAAAAAGSLSTGIPLAGAAAGGAGAAGDLTTGIPLAGDATGSGAATGDISVPGAELAGAATGSGAASGAIDTGIPLDGAAVGGASAAGGLTTGIPLAGAAAGAGAAQGDLSTGVPLTGAATGSGTATGTLADEIGGGGELPALLGAAAVASATASGDLSTGIPLAGAAGGAGTATGALSTLAAPTIDAGALGPSPVTVTGTGIPGALIDLDVDGTVFIGFAAVDGGGSWGGGLAGGSGVYSVSARQVVGPNTSGWSAPVAVVIIYDVVSVGAKTHSRGASMHPVRRRSRRPHVDPPSLYRPFRRPRAF